MKRHNRRRHVAIGAIVTAISGAMLANAAPGAGIPAPPGSVFTVDNESGTARTIDVVNFYDTRFELTLSDQQKADLIAFLRSL